MDIKDVDEARKVRYNKALRVVNQFVKAINDNLKEGFECSLEHSSLANEQQSEIRIVISQNRSQRLFGTIGDSRPWEIAIVTLDYYEGYPTEVTHILGEDPRVKYFGGNKSELETALLKVLESTYVTMVMALYLR